MIFARTDVNECTKVWGQFLSVPRFNSSANQLLWRGTNANPIAKRRQNSMNTNLVTRRDFSVRLASFISGLGITRTTLSLSGTSAPAVLAVNEEISRNSESIHHEVFFKASRNRVYEALTVAEQFGKLTGAPTEISREVGGTFSIFGGHIVGRNLELAPNERIVQAWRVVDWDVGLYSIAKFELKEVGSNTKIVFDHTSFPQGYGKHLAEGWKSHYWEPVEKYLQ
jgi:activator of HSP90 ATPase